MKRPCKKLSGLLLVLGMLLSLLPMTALATPAPAVTIGTTTLEDGKYYTAKEGADPSYALVDASDTQPSAGTPYLYYSGGTLTVSGYVSLTSTGPSVLYFSIATLTIDGSASDKLTLNGTGGPAVSAETSTDTLNLSGSLNFTVNQTNNAPAVNNAQLQTSGSYAGNINLSGSGSASTIYGNVDISSAGDVTIQNTGSGIAVSGALTVSKAQNVSVTSAASSAPAITGNANISVSGNVTINGNYMAISDSLTITAAQKVTVTGASSAPAIGSNANITVSGDVVINNTSIGMAISGALMVTDAQKVTVTAASGAPAISSSATITASGDVEIKNTGTGMSVSGALMVTAAQKVTVTAASDAPAIGSSATITASGDVVIKNTGTGMAVSGALTVTAAQKVTVTAASSAPAISSSATITASGDVEIQNTGSNVAIWQNASIVTTGGSIKVSGKGNAPVIAAGGTYDVTLHAYGNVLVQRTEDSGSSAPLINAVSPTLTSDTGTVIVFGSTGLSSTQNGITTTYATGGNVSATELNLSSSTPTVPTWYLAGNGYILWDPILDGSSTVTSGTLTLTGATIDSSGYALYLPNVPVTIEADGTNDLKASYDGIYHDGDTVIEGKGTLSIESSGTNRNGILQENGSLTVSGGLTLTVGGDYGVYIEDGTFILDDSSTFTANAAVAAICVVDKTGLKPQSDAIDISSAMLPSGKTISSAVGDTSTYGYTYWSIMNVGNTLTATAENSTPAILSGAAGSLTLKSTMEPPVIVTIPAQNTSQVTTTTSGGTAVISSPVTATTDSSGKTSGSISSDTAKELLDGAKAAEASGSRAAVEIKLETGSEATEADVTIPKDSFNSLAAETSTDLTIKTGIGTITFDAKAVDAISGGATAGNVKFSIAKVDTASLSAENQAIIGSRPVYDFTVTSGGTTISQFGGGSAAISIPYTLAADEDPNKIVIYYLSDSGALVPVTNCSYDAATGMVTFSTSHFSKYAVVYNNVAFTDVSGWYADVVYFLAARGIMTGAGGNTFSPEASITRAEFVTILANLSGVDLSSYTTTSFSDVKTTDWYSQEVQWAYTVGIVSGYDGKFDPLSKITRQDMAAIILRYTENVSHFTLRATVPAVTFNDNSEIASYAANAVKTMQQAGIISGKDGGLFAPKDNASRAEAAAMIARLIKIMIG